MSEIIYMNLWDLYLSDEKYHYHCSNNIFENTFNDALSMQGERIINNIMKSLNCSEKRAHEIAFCDVREQEV